MHRAQGLGLTVILEAQNKLALAVVEDIPRHATFLGNDTACLFGVSVVLVREPLALRIDLKTALHHQRPAYKNAVRMCDRAVALVRPQMLRIRA